MNFRDLLEGFALTAGITVLGVSFFFYYTKESFRNGVNKVLRFLPALFTFTATRTKDTTGVFDLHDGLVLTGRLLTHLRETIQDPANTEFADVEDDVYAFMSRELQRYRAAGLKNVPEISDKALRAQVRLVFEELKRVTAG